MGISTRLRLIIILSIILVIAFVSISLINYRTTRDAVLTEIVSSSLPLLRENIYSEIQDEFIPLLNHASLMANNSFLKQWALEGENDAEEVLQFLKEVRGKYGYFSTFYVSHRSRNYYHFSGILKQISRSDKHDVWYYDFIDSGIEYDLDVDANQAENDLLTIFVNFRLEDSEGKLLGVTGVGIQMDKFSAILRDKQNRYDRTISLVDEQGLIQAHPDKQLIQKITLREQSGIQDIAGTILTKSELPVNADFMHEGRRVLVTSRYMPELNWFLIVEQEEAAVMKTARAALLRTILIGLLTSLVIITITVLIINHYQSRLEKYAGTDELTATANRRELQSHLTRQLSRFRRSGDPVSIILLDVDHFKLINDSQGHLKGDHILREIARIIQQCIRPVDLLARWGGDEFVLLLECDTETALATAERLRGALKEQNIRVSMGVTGYRADESTDSFFARADEALYQAKENGRDRISIL
jgi:diguanylate cyclase (GGDEF)-like protein